MGKASSTKKIQRVQRAGTRKVAGQRRPLGFPLACLAIMVVGSVGVWLARDAKQNVAFAAPVLNQDHWHYAFGFYQCDQYPDGLQKPTDATSDVLGIHSHGDGLIHIHPFSTSTAGKRATLGKFLEQEGITMTADELTFPASMGGATFKNGDTCTIDGKKQKAELKVFVWPPQASAKVKPDVFTDDFDNIRFTQDQGILSLAFVPESVKKIPLPPSIEALKDPLAAEQGTPQPDVGSTTVLPVPSTTVPAASASTTAAPSVTTTAPAAPTTTGG
jgi:hypothetical protein